MYVVVYAKIVDDRDGLGALMTGVFVGGVAPTEEEATGIATDCTDTIQGGLVIPRVMEIRNNMRDTIDDAMKIFNRMADDMYEVENAITRSRK